MYLIRSPKGGLALVSAGSEMDAKLDLDANCYGVDLAEVTLTELPLESSNEGVVEIHAFTDGRALI
jgi:hypothetical protein